MANKNDFKIFGFLFLFVFILEFWISINSYTHDLYNRIDSAIFFMSGKAWMNGMIPYVDFSDSKGPLLWLIYGIGYLFNNYNYTGIFWIECVFYTFTFFYCYKISYLFLENKKISLLCSIIMALSFFCGAYHYETRAEDFCQLFIMSGLYYTLKVLYGSINDKEIQVASLIVGVSFAAALLIKFTIAAMILIFFFAIFCYIMKCKKYLIWKIFLYSFYGFFIVSLPFILYFLYFGNFFHFINEYFIVTSHTIVGNLSLGEMLSKYIFEGWGYFANINIIKRIVIYFLMINIVLGCIYFYKKLSAFKLFPAIITFWFICVSMYHALGYYYHSFSGFAIFPVIMYVSFFIRFKLKKRHFVLISSIIIMIVISGNLVFTRPNFFLNKTEERKDFYYVNRILSQIHNPKLIYSFFDFGYGTPAGALPGCKYWTCQVGASKNMISEREHALKQQLPDFVIVCFANDFDNLIEQSGYIKYYSWITQQGRTFLESHLYGKQGLILPSKDFQVSSMDVLLKRRIIPVKSEN